MALRYSETELRGAVQVPSPPTFLDWTHQIPGYGDDPNEHWADPRQALITAIETSGCSALIHESPWTEVRSTPASPLQPVTVFIDSIDTLRSDLNSTAKTSNFLSGLLQTLKARQVPGRLILPISLESLLIPHITSASLSSTIVHLTLHSTYLLTHISQSYLTAPPISSHQPSDRFWSLFLPAAQRREGEKLVLGGQDGAYRGENEGVIEIAIRGGRKGVERSLEAWRVKVGEAGGHSVEACLCGELGAVRATLPKLGNSVTTANEVRLDLGPRKGEQTV